MCSGTGKQGQQLKMNSHSLTNQNRLLPNLNLLTSIESPYSKLDAWTSVNKLLKIENVIFLIFLKEFEWTNEPVVALQPLSEMLEVMHTNSPNNNKKSKWSVWISSVQIMYNITHSWAIPVIQIDEGLSVSQVLPPPGLWNIFSSAKDLKFCQSCILLHKQLLHTLLLVRVFIINFK